MAQPPVTGGRHALKKQSEPADGCDDRDGHHRRRLPSGRPGRASSDAAVSPMPRLGSRAGSVRYGWHYVSMTAVSLDHLWHHLAAWADRQGQPPSHLLILGTALLAAAMVASHRAWPLARTVVTIVHEGGHALAAVATGRRVHGVRVLHTSAGVTVTTGNPSGP